MTVIELMKILQTVPDGIHPIVKGRRDWIVGVSIPDREVPEGWQATNEGAVYKIPGYRRIRWTKRSV